MCHALLRAIWTITDFSIHADLDPSPCGYKIMCAVLMTSGGPSGLEAFSFSFLFLCLFVLK